MTASDQPRDGAGCCGDAPEPGGRRRLSLWLGLLACTATIEKEVRARMRLACGLTLPRYDLMAILSRAHAEGVIGLSMGELSERLRVSNGNVTGVVDRLEDDGLVRRTPHPEDRRTTLVALTPRGEQAFAHMAQEHDRWIDELLGSLSDDEVETLGTLVDHLRQSCERLCARLDGEPIRRGSSAARYRPRAGELGAVPTEGCPDAGAVTPLPLVARGDDDR